MPTAQHLVPSFSAATRGRNPSKFEVGASDTSPPPAAPSGRPPGIQREEKPRRIHLMAATYLETIGARLLDLTGRSGMFWLPFTHGSTWVYLHTARILNSPTHPTTTLATRLALVLLLLKGCYISARAHTHTDTPACTHIQTTEVDCTRGGPPTLLSLPSFFFLLQHTMLRRFRILIFSKAASTLRLVGMQTQELEGTFFSLFCDFIQLSFLGREKSCMKSTQANSKQEQLLHFSSRFPSEATLTEEQTYRPKLGRRVGGEGMRKRRRKEESL